MTMNYINKMCKNMISWKQCFLIVQRICPSLQRIKNKASVSCLSTWHHQHHRNIFLLWHKIVVHCKNTLCSSVQFSAAFRFFHGLTPLGSRLQLSCEDLRSVRVHWMKGLLVLVLVLKNKLNAAGWLQNHEYMNCPNNVVAMCRCRTMGEEGSPDDHMCSQHPPETRMG